MSDHGTRRTFLKHSAAAVAALQASAIAAGGRQGAGEVRLRHLRHPVRRSRTRSRTRCPICQDERQYVGHGGQKWTTLDEYKKTHKNVFTEEEAGPALDPPAAEGRDRPAGLPRPHDGGQPAVGLRAAPGRRDRRAR